MTRRPAALLLPLLLALLPGCSTVVTILVPSLFEPPGSLLWSGTRADCGALFGSSPFIEVPTRIFALFDLPLSLAADSALLPATLVQSIGVWSHFSGHAFLERYGLVFRGSSDSPPVAEPAPEPAPPAPPPRPAPLPRPAPERDTRERTFDAPREYRLERRLR